MKKKPSYSELEQRITELEKKVSKYSAKNRDEKYRILFEKSKDAILIIENGKFVDFNQATVDMLGYQSKAEIIDTHPSDLSPACQPDGQDSFKKAKQMMDIALEKGSHRFEWNHLRADGRVLPVEVLLTTISRHDDHWIMHTIWRDISRQKQMDKARQKEKETLSTILESTPHGIALIDNQGNYLYVNPHFTEITGYTLNDIPTKDVWFKKAYPDKEYRKQIAHTWKNDSTQLGAEMIREFKIQTKNGRSKYVEFRSNFLADQKITVLTDVTSRRKSEEIIREKDRLQGVLELSGAVCHEMSQPLMSIMGYFDLFLMDVSKDDPVNEKIEKIYNQINKLSNITKKLMKISRYETKEYLKEKIVDLTRASTRG